VPLKWENRGADRGSLAKGGEEKSPYSRNFSTRSPGLLDVEHTITLFLFDNDNCQGADTAICNDYCSFMARG